MTSRPLIVLLLLTLTACEPEDDTRVPDAPPAPAATDEVDDRVPAADAEEASEVVHAFHRALASGDSVAAMGMLHPEAVIYEAGHAETLDEYRAGHLAADIRFATATERHVLEEQTLATEATVLYLAETHTSGRLNDWEIDARGVETVLLVRAPEGWRIRTSTGRAGPDGSREPPRQLRRTWAGSSSHRLSRVDDRPLHG